MKEYTHSEQQSYITTNKVGIETFSTPHTVQDIADLPDMPLYAGQRIVGSLDVIAQNGSMHVNVSVAGLASEYNYMRNGSDSPVSLVQPLTPIDRDPLKNLMMRLVSEKLPYTDSKELSVDVLFPK
ncbi:MAG: hypothetical protein GY861_24855 [bacterium]|nr:hypothetical protein [bacterium]